MTITVYVLCWNEIFLLPHFFKHYSWADRIIVYDNGSTDGSQEFVAAQPKGELRYYDSGMFGYGNNQYDNRALIDVKNEAWKDDASDWVVVCDMDEFLLGHQFLSDQKNCVLQCEGWQIVSDRVPEDLKTVKMGFRDPFYDKCLCFTPTIQDISYDYGCHTCNPVGASPKRDFRLKLLHYSYLSEEYLVNKWKRLFHRQSQFDIDNRLGAEVQFSKERIRAIYRSGVQKAVRLKFLQEAKFL